VTPDGYAAPEPPAFERAGVLEIRSLAECADCEQRSAWWFGQVPARWPAQHARRAHPESARVRFRMWRIVRHGAWIEPDDRLARTPAASTPADEPRAFALAECRACGAGSDWLAADEYERVANWEQSHQRAAHPKARPDFDRWHLTRKPDPGPRADSIHENGQPA
jgi:hypothetical protein